MTRFIALLVAAVLALGVAATPVLAQKEAGAAGGAKQVPREKIDINSASEAELQMLPGIGDALARKIVDNRPYKRKDELAQRKVIPGPTYDKIKDHVIARQSTADKKADTKRSDRPERATTTK